MTENKKIFITNDRNKAIIDEYLNYYKAKRPKASKHTIRGKRQTLEHLSDYLQKHTKHKSLKKASEQDMINFFNNPNYVTEGSYNLFGNNLLPFYRWIFDMDRFTRPSNMKWFERTSEITKRKFSDPHRKEKLLIYTDEYEKIMNFSKDIFGQNKALWETYYLSGFRPEEVPSMNIGDVREDEDHIVWVSCPKSKTYPREIPLHHYPENLIRYIGNHPLRNNKKNPLFFNVKGTTKLQRLDVSSVERRFRDIRTKLKLKPTLKVKSFRKTRATKLFSSDDPKINNDTHIGKYMGWQPSVVIFRRQEYNLTNKEDLKAVIKDRPKTSLMYDTIKGNLEEIENKYLPIIKKLEKENKDIKGKYKELKEVSDENREAYANLKDEINKKLEEISNPNSEFYENLFGRIIGDIPNEEIKALVKKGFPEYLEIIKGKSVEERLKIADDWIKKGKIPKELDEMIED